MSHPPIQEQLERLAGLIKKRQFDEAMDRLIQRQYQERAERLNRCRQPSDREDWADVETAFAADRPVDSGV